MNTNIKKLAPYAPFGCVIAIIRRLRERGLPETLTIQEITRVGVSEGNASRTLQALKFLKCPVPDIINTATRRGIGSNGYKTEELYAGVQTQGGAGKHAA